MAKRDYYDVLGVSRQATQDEIKRAYRKLAKQNHPDTSKGDAEASTRFKEAHEAYAVLSDKDKRERYDRFGHAATSAGGGGGAQGEPFVWTNSGKASPVDIDLDDLAQILNFGRGQGKRREGGSAFDQFFGGTRVQPVHEKPAERDIEYPVNLTFEQALRGTTLELELSNNRRGKEQLSVKIPEGVRDGQRVRVRGKGQPARGRQPAGDLYVVCRVQPHRYYERDGDDIYLSVPVTVGEATLGAKIELPTPDGPRTVTIPPGTSGGTKLRLAGLGVPNAATKARGDFFVVIKIVPPKTLSAQQRERMERFAEDDETAPRRDLWT